MSFLPSKKNKFNHKKPSNTHYIKTEESYDESNPNIEPLDADNALSESNEHRFLRAKTNDITDRRFGFETFVGPGEKTGWLLNMHPSDILDESKRLVSAIDLYFLCSDGSRFKVTRSYLPYFYVRVSDDQNIERDTTTYLMRRYSGRIASVEIVAKEDLDLPNHLVGLKANYLKLLFYSVDELVRVRKELLVKIRANRELITSKSSYTNMLAEHFSTASDATNSSNVTTSKSNQYDPLENLIDIRESDVPYLTRVCIDLNIFAGSWYVIKCKPSLPPEITKHEDTIAWAEPVVLAFDIETTKLPLKFPDSTNDQIMMLSYMIDGSGYLVCNREILSEDIDDFDFTPRAEFPGHFTVHNLPNEFECIKFFFEHIQKVQPNIIVTYNGDYFDWPFVEARAAHYGLSMFEEIAFSKHKSSSGSVGRAVSWEYLSRPVVHIDCLCWVKRDSYLPVGARGLKAVAKAKLRYDPIEVDPELMCKMARESPRELANYSVSDAVATYYLYMKYIHPFVFALCTILPLNPDDVLRKGSGTLCEALLMVQAYTANVIFPHKQSGNELGVSNSDYDVPGNFTDDGKLIDSETYVGGHVEALEAGVFRADIPIRFRLIPAALETLRSDVRRCLRETLQSEVGADEDTFHNFVSKEEFDKVCQQVENSLTKLSATPNRIECPVIYHLDVGAMYPNIILTNRLQPSAVDSDSTAKCSQCHFYKADVECQRFMPWTWRADLWTASRSEIYRIHAQLAQERFQTKVFDSKDGSFKSIPKAFHELPKDEQFTVRKKRLSEFCRRAYKRIHLTRTEKRVAMVCQRENPFYVDTVRDFRDRRYKFKDLTKIWKRRYDEACAALSAGTGDSTTVKEANAMLVLYDSLQLAHKCILNSFYGYVMRRGARWYSMEMAGIVCHTGANIITKAREIIEQIGRALELDTDGIWCVLPASFPQNLQFNTIGPKSSKIFISYPGAVLNIMVQDLFTNHQYHELVDKKSLTYKTRSENTIFFEVDGPYKAMVLPAAKEEGKRLKKRYAVFNFDGSLAELKGFEIKRNGELQLIKIFQSSVFESFLRGASLVEVYSSVASVADHWLDVLYSKGADMPDCELFDLIAENRSMSKRLEDYGNQKSTSLSTARRMAEFLGDQIVKDAGLSCRYVISRQPEGAPVTERAIPLAIFQAESSIKRHYLRKWLKDSSLDEHTDLREILDWSYYIERLSSAIQKIITIPAALQHVPNPVPRVSHPDWLLRRLAEKTDTFKQRKLTDLYSSNLVPVSSRHQNDFDDKKLEDIEDQGSISNSAEPKIMVTKHLGTNSGLKRKMPSGPPKHWREELGDPPLLDEANDKESLTAWLAFHQAKWRLQRERRKYLTTLQTDNNSLIGDNMIPYSKRQCGMDRYLNQTKLVLLNTVWQIIEIVPDYNQPGHFALWVLIVNQGSGIPPALHYVNLTLPRRFYVNLRAPKPNDVAPLYRKVSGSNTNQEGNSITNSYILPRNHPVHHLYEYDVPEEVYQAHTSDLVADLARPDIEGVYELGVPNLFRIFIKLGCLCTVDKEAITKSDQSGLLQEDLNFKMDYLRICSVAQYPYLNNCPLRHVFLFHYQLPTPRRDASRQIYLLIVPWTQKGYVCLIDSAKINQLPDLNTLYVKQRAKLFSAHDKNEFPPDSISFEVRVESDISIGRRAVQRWLTALRQGANMSSVNTQSKENSEFNQTSASKVSNSPIAVLLHTSLYPAHQTVSNNNANQTNWSTGEVLLARRRNPNLPILAEFPVIPLGGTMDENESQTFDDQTTDAYNLLNWQSTVIKRGLKYFMQSEVRFERQLELARYLHIPVGNIPTSESPFSVKLQHDSENSPLPPASCLSAIELGCDLFYARHLMKHNHILWCSMSGRPDLGGKETDDQRLLLEMEESSIVDLNRPGSYPHVTVQLELSNLAVNTLIVANRIPQLEGATLMTFDRLSVADKPIEEQLNQGVNLGTSITNYDETAACSAAFRVLRNMVLAWVRDVTQYRNPLADEQIIYFYQWLCSPRSLFYDPALRRTVQKLMKKVFLKLVDEMSHLHVDVVYASFSRIIMSTYRIELPEALARVEHLIQLLRNRPGTLFTHLDMQFVGGWRQLLWLDSSNFSGVKINIDNLVDGKDVEWDQTAISLLNKKSIKNNNNVVDDDDDDDDSNNDEDNEVENTQTSFEPEIDLNWHIGRYLPVSRGLRDKFQSLLAGYILAVYNAVRNEHCRMKQLSLSQTEAIANKQSTKTVNKDQTSSEEDNPYKSDVTICPGVLEFQESLIRDQLAPELYSLIIRLNRKAAWIDLDNMSDKNVASELKDKLVRNQEIVFTYLAEKSLITNGVESHANIPLLPPHQAVYSLQFRPLLDFVKAFTEILSLDNSIKLQISGLRKDLLRLLNVGEFSPEASWIAPHLICDCALDENPSKVVIETASVRSLLVYLPEVACPTCNFTRDIDACRDTHIVQMTNSTDPNVSGCWTWICSHCRTIYPRGRLEDALVQQIEQISLQHCLQDLQCSKCMVGGGIQEAILSGGGSVGQCAECSSNLLLTVPAGQALYRRLDVYRLIGLHFGFVHLEQMALWLMKGLQTC